MTFRFLLQPTMAAIAALHDGVKDARAGRPPFFWSMLSNRAGWGSDLREALVSTGRIILLGIAMDTIYQLIVFDSFYPAETAIVALLLAVVPYLILRGPISRIARWWLGKTSFGEVR